MVTMPSGKVFNFADSEGIILRLWKRTDNNISYRKSPQTY